MYSRNDIDRDHRNNSQRFNTRRNKDNDTQRGFNQRTQNKPRDQQFKKVDQFNKNHLYQNDRTRENNTFRKQNDRNDGRTRESNDDNIDVEIKKMVLDYIYSKLELVQYKYVLLEYELDLPRLKEKTYLISPNYNGINSLMVYIKIKDKFMSFIVDRKTLMYNIKDLNYSKVKMYRIKFRADREIYNGTIFDGVMLHHNGKRHFILNDIYYFRGDDLTTEKLQSKMINITTYLNTHTNDNNDIIIFPNIFKKITDIQQLMEKDIPTFDMYKYIKGISFYPEYSGTKLIYLYNSATRDNNQNNILSTHTHVLLDAEESNINAIFKVNKTSIVDVYNLYLGEIVVENNVKLFKTKNVGIAYVPTKDCSFFCKEIFNNVDTVFMMCVYDKNKKLWIPMKVVDDCKRPDLIIDVDKKIL